MASFEASPVDASGLGRRRLLLGAGGVAAAAGAGVAWWRYQPHQPQDGATALLWQQKFANLQGETQGLSQWRGKRLLINFWATWCPPCVRELPLLSEFSTRFGEHGVRVLGLAIDKNEAVQKFLARQPLHFPVLLASEGGLGFTRSLGNTQGSLPFSILLNAEGSVRQSKIGELSASELVLWSQKG